MGHGRTSRELNLSATSLRAIEMHRLGYACKPSASLELKKNYIDTGKVRYVSRDLPLDFHLDARSGAVAARCAGQQHKFWEMRDMMFFNAEDLSPTSTLIAPWHL
jgi:protein-disulfide isomerase